MCFVLYFLQLLSFLISRAASMALYLTHDGDFLLVSLNKTVSIAFQRRQEATMGGNAVRLAEQFTLNSMTSTSFPGSDAALLFSDL